MTAREILSLIVIGSFATYAVARLLLVAYFAMKRKHMRNVIRDITENNNG